MYNLKNDMIRYSSPQEQVQYILNDIYNAQTDRPTNDSCIIAQRETLEPQVMMALMDIVFSKNFRVTRSLTTNLVSFIKCPELITQIFKRIIKEKIFKDLNLENTSGYHIRSLLKIIDISQNIDAGLLKELYFSSDIFIQERLADRNDFPSDLLMDLYNKTNDEKYLPKNIKDIFIF